MFHAVSNQCGGPHLIDGNTFLVATTLDIIGFDSAFTFCAVAVLAALVLRFGAAQSSRGFTFARVAGNRSYPTGMHVGQLADEPLVADQGSSNAAVVAGDVEQMPIDEQWERVSDFLRSTLDAGATVQEKHNAASRQLDAVDYALTCLLDELRPLMPKAGRMDDDVVVVACTGDTVETKATDDWRDDSIAA